MRIKDKDLIRKIIISLLLLTSGAFAADDPVTQARALLEQEKYGEAFTLLKNSQRDKSTPDSLRFEILKQLAVSYETKVGAYQTVLRYHQNIVNSPTAGQYPVFEFAEREIARLKAMQKKYYMEDLFLKNIRYSSINAMQIDELLEKNKQVLELIENQPEYYRMAEVYYCLAQNFTALKQYGKALQFYKKSIQLKPAIDFFLPVSSRSRFVLRVRNRIATHTTAWATLAFLLGVTMITFYGSRPWQWLSLKHFLILPGMLSIWWLLFTVSSFILGEIFRISDKTLTEMLFEMPAFINAAPGSPGSELLQVLLKYGIAGLSGVFIFSLGISKLKNRLIKSTVSVLYGLLLFGSLTAVFYLRHCDGRSKFYSEGQNLVNYFGGNNYFNLTEHKAYVLSDPKSYSNLDISNVDEPELADWILAHCRNDSSNVNEH